MSYPIQIFRFEVEFRENSIAPGSPTSQVLLCRGAFSECTGLEATMEPKVIKEGGRNYGVVQRTGPVTFAPVILRRGMTYSRDLWRWFEHVCGGAVAHRLDVTISMKGDRNAPEVLAWHLTRALPVKFKAADLKGSGSEIAVEELQLAHEGLNLLRAGTPPAGN